MAEWEVNKGIGRSVELKGLKAQYLFIFAGGLLTVFVITVILYLCGIGQAFCLVLCLAGSTVVVWLAFSMNRKYGEHGLMKRAAAKYHPDFLINRKSAIHLFTKNKSHDKQT